MTQKTKLFIVSSSSNRKSQEKTWRGRKEMQEVFFIFIFSERECDISLRFWAIRPSEFFGARRKAALRGEVYA